MLNTQIAIDLWCTLLESVASRPYNKAVSIAPPLELPHGKTNKMLGRKQGAVHFLFFLNPKFQASSCLLWLYSPVCVRPVQKPNCWFSHEAAHLFSGEVQRVSTALGNLWLCFYQCFTHTGCSCVLLAIA